MDSKIMILRIHSDKIGIEYCSGDIQYFLPGIIMSEFLHSDEFYEISKDSYAEDVGFTDTGDLAALDLFLDQMRTVLSDALRRSSRVDLLLKELSKYVISDITLIDKDSLVVRLEVK